MTVPEHPERSGHPSQFNTDGHLSDEELRKRQYDVLVRNAEHTAQQIAELSEAMHVLRRDVPKMMAEGIRAAVGDPATWEAARNAMRMQAKSAAGGWLLGVLAWAGEKMLWGALLVVLIYWGGGLPAIAAFFKLKGLP